MLVPKENRASTAESSSADRTRLARKKGPGGRLEIQMVLLHGRSPNEVLQDESRGQAPQYLEARTKIHYTRSR